MWIWLLYGLFIVVSDVGTVPPSLFAIRAIVGDDDDDVDSGGGDGDDHSSDHSVLFKTLLLHWLSCICRVLSWVLSSRLVQPRPSRGSNLTSRGTSPRYAPTPP